MEHAKQQIAQCRSYEECRQIPALYAKLPEEQKKDPEFAKLFVENCDGFPKNTFIPELFGKFTDDTKRDANISNLAMEKCNGSHIPQLFGSFTDDMKRDENISSLAMEKCYGSSIPQLFDRFTDDMKRVENISNLAMEKCHFSNIPQLFGNFTKDMKNDNKIASLAVEKCSIFSIQDLFRQFPNHVLSNIAERIEKLDSDKVPALFAFLPESMKSDPKMVIKFIQECSVLRIPELFELFPEQMKNHKDVISALDTASFATAPFCTKHKFLIVTLLRLTCAMTLFLLPECISWAVTGVSPAFSALRSKHWGGTGSNTSFYPVKGCKLVPPQPFDLKILLDMLKMSSATLALGFLSRNLLWAGHTATKWWERALFVAVAIYATLVVPVAMISVVLHFFNEVNGNIEGGFWQHYECFYATWGSGPYNFNYQLLFIRLCGSYAVLDPLTSEENDLEEQEGNVAPRTGPIEAEFRKTFADIIMHKGVGVTHGTPSRCLPPMSLSESLLRGTDTKVQLERRKMQVSLVVPLLITAVPYIIVDIPFTITHKLPACIIFSPFLFAWLLLMYVVLRITWPFSSKSAVQLLEEAGRAGFLPFLPVLFGLSVANEFLTLAPIYLYSGEGWLNSGLLVFIERNMHTYLEALSSRILPKVWCITNLFSQLV